MATTPDAAATIEDPIVQVDGITAGYGNTTVLHEVSLDVGDGEVVCLIGPNGSGKTTVLRLLLGLTQPTAGEVQREDVVVGCGFQSPNFYPGLTVAENIAVFSRLVGAPDLEWREILVEELRLERAMERRSGDLSGGFARKLDLALALLKRPNVLLLDEPLGALDDVSKARLLQFLADYADLGNTVLVSTHHLADFEPHLDRVTMMHDAEVVLDRAPESIDLADGESLQAFYVRRVLEREGVGPEPGEG